MNRIFDSHMHLNLSEDNPVGELLSQMESSGIDQAVLILNRREEDALLRKYAHMQGQLNKKLSLAIWADYHENSHFLAAEFWRAKGFSVYTKLHPRISGITVNDFPSICSMLQNDLSKTIIIDCFGYGHHIEHHTGIELGIVLAQTFPEKHIVLAHAGGEQLLKCMLYTRTLPNIYYDISLTCNYLFHSSVHADMVQLLRYNASRVMYGSDYPDFLPDSAIKNVMSLCLEAGLNAEEIQRIFEENARKIYGIK